MRANRAGDQGRRARGWARGRRGTGPAPSANVAAAAPVAEGYRAPPVRAARITDADVMASGPSFWEEYRLELMLVSVLLLAAAIIVGVLFSVYDAELERLLRKISLVARRQLASHPWLAQFVR